MVQHMHVKWDEADKEMQKLYIMMKRNYKNISKLAQIYEKEKKAKEEAEQQQQRENEEMEYQKQQTRKDNDDDDQKQKRSKQKIKKRILRRRTKAERDHFKGAARLLRGLKSVNFTTPKRPSDVKLLTKEWIKFVNKYIDGMDEIDLKNGTLSDTENIKFPHVESIHVTEFKGIFEQIIDCVSALNDLLIARDVSYMNHMRSVMQALPFKPKLIINIVSDLAPKMLDISKYIEVKQLRSQNIETINVEKYLGDKVSDDGRNYRNIQFKQVGVVYMPIPKRYVIVL